MPTASSTRYLVTGASGFIGRQITSDLLKDGHRVRIIVRSAANLTKSIEQHPNLEIYVADLTSIPEWEPLLRDTDTIIHLAGRAHIFDGSDSNALRAYRALNVDASAHLAKCAAIGGVRRLIFASSIKVNGEATYGYAYRADDPAAPEDMYGQTKWEAEQALFEIGAKTGLEICAIRPPLVYGPDVRGNFDRLVTWVRSGWPLPFASIENRRCMIGVRNLSNLIRLCATHPSAAGEVVLAAEGPGLSTPEVIRKIANAYGCRANLVAVPPPILRAILEVSGRGGIWRRLAGSLEVDASKTVQLLEWEPQYSMSDELLRMAQHHTRHPEF